MTTPDRGARPTSSGRRTRSRRASTARNTTTFGWSSRNGRGRCGGRARRSSWSRRTGQIPPYTPELLDRLEAREEAPAASRRGGYLGGPQPERALHAAAGGHRAAGHRPHRAGPPAGSRFCPTASSIRSSCRSTGASRSSLGDPRLVRPRARALGRRQAGHRDHELQTNKQDGGPRPPVAPGPPLAFFPRIRRDAAARRDVRARAPPTSSRTG